MGKLDNGKGMSLPFDSFEFSTEKKMHNVRVMRMAAWETAPHIALRNCSKEMGLGVGETIYM